MSQWEKLLRRILLLSKDLRFDELRKVLESCGYQMFSPSQRKQPLYLSQTRLHADHNSQA